MKDVKGGAKFSADTDGGEEECKNNLNIIPVTVCILEDSGRCV